MEATETVALDRGVDMEAELFALPEGYRQGEDDDDL